jgi:hypothetical protein
VEEGIGGHRALVPAFEERVERVGIRDLPGVHEAVAEMTRIATHAVPIHLRPAEVDARMSAMARYDQLGFEAAAVAGMGIRATAMPGTEKVLRLRFDRPHVVIAVAEDERFAGLPLFVAWVDAGAREPEPPLGG